jgi:xanthine dehydrogenase accessory factor
VARQRLPDPGIRLLVGNYSQLIEEIKIEPNSAIVIVTRGHQFDEVCLRGTIKSNAGYLGMIGSKRRVVSVINRLKNDGYSDVDFSKLHAPIGLSIGAKSPQEIAIAIHAEIINHFNNRE